MYSLEVRNIKMKYDNFTALSDVSLKVKKTEFAVATVNDKKRAEYLLSNGVQSVLTDNPEILN